MTRSNSRSSSLATRWIYRKRLGRLSELRILLPEDLAELSGTLRRLTNRIMYGETALWRRDRAKIDLLAAAISGAICNARIDKISRIYWLIEDCKRYGTLPFAGLARAGFIAVQMLQSLVEVGVLNTEESATIHGQRRYHRVAYRAGFRAAFRRQSFLRATATSAREPTTFCRRVMMKRPISISTGRVLHPAVSAPPRFALSI
jgi:hypothetical protein